MSDAWRGETRLLAATPGSIREGAEILRRGGLVAFPTETVYGLGADAENPAAVRAMFAAKGRPADHPVIVHLRDATELSNWASEIPSEAEKLAKAFWPGPLTLVLRRSERASDLVTGGLETVGLRVPGHPVAQVLLRQFGGALAAPSANRFGSVSPTQARHVLTELSGRVELILDGGNCQVGLESTIVDLSRGVSAILRPGGVTAEAIATVLSASAAGNEAGAPRVSGSLPSHYAPRARVEVVTAAQLAERAHALASQGLKVAVLVRGELSADLPPAVRIIVLPATDEAMARELYATLRQVDELSCDAALVALPAEAGLGTAIADRLRRAAGSRE